MALIDSPLSRDLLLSLSFLKLEKSQLHLSVIRESEWTCGGVDGDNRNTVSYSCSCTRTPIASTASLGSTVLISIHSFRHHNHTLPHLNRCEKSLSLINETLFSSYLSLGSRDFVSDSPKAAIRVPLSSLCVVVYSSLFGTKAV